MKLDKKIAKAIRNAECMSTSHLKTYVTQGGTYMIATPGMWSDDGAERDLIAINRYGNVIQLSPTLNPDLLDAVVEAMK